MPIRDEEEALEALKGKWHQKCFKCAVSSRRSLVLWSRAHTSMTVLPSTDPLGILCSHQSQTVLPRLLRTEMIFTLLYPKTSRRCQLYRCHHCIHSHRPQFEP